MNKEQNGLLRAHQLIGYFSLLIGFIYLRRAIATLQTRTVVTPQAYLSTCSGCLVRVVCSGEMVSYSLFGFFVISGEPLASLQQPSIFLLPCTYLGG